MTDAVTAVTDGQIVLSPPARPRICFITTEFHGLFRNGGIGTANTGLALALADAGFEVTVAFADSDQRGPRVKVGDFQALKTQYEPRRIKLDYVPPPADMPDAFNDPRSASYAVFLYVQRGGFDTVLFNDNGGQGFYSLLAKHAGLFRDPPAMYVVTHGPYNWVYDLNAVEYEGRLPVMVGYMERRCAELADILISPSQYLLDWMIGQGWTMPAHHCVVQNVIGVAGASSVGVPSATPFNEIVFFGRQEIRKGLELFCDAIDMLHGMIDLSDVRVTFLGKFGQVAGVHSGVYLVERALGWRCSLRMLGNYDQAEALDYLRRPGVLAVIPSLAENSPCVVVECLELGIPFLATEGGGTPELIAENDRNRCLFPPVPAALATRMDKALRLGHPAAKLAVAQDQTLRQWVALLTQNIDAVLMGKPKPARSAQPLVSICFLRASAKAACVSTVAQQIYPNIEILFADAPDVEVDDDLAFGPHTVRSVAVFANSRAAARNAAAQQAKGDYLFFLDEATVTLAPDCIARLVASAVGTRAEIVTCLPVRTRGGHPRMFHFPVGGCAELGAFENCFGGEAFMVSAKTFRRVGGFSVTWDARVLDWAFLASAVLRGVRLEVVPLQLFTQDRDALTQFDAGMVVRGHRSVFQVYAGQRASLFFRVLESVPGVREHHREQAKGALDRIGGRAQEIAVALSALDPNKPDADRAFIDYCCERRLIDLAVDFALWNGKEMLNEVVTSAGRVREAEALAMIGQRRIAFPHTVDLTETLRDMLVAIRPLRQHDLAFPADCLVSHAGGIGVQIVKVSGGCPDGSRIVTARARFENSATLSPAVAIAVVDPGARITVGDDNQISGDSLRWTGWVPAADAVETALRLELSVPPEEVLDVYFLSRADDLDDAGALVTWLSAQAVVAVEGRSNSVVRQTGLKPISPEAIYEATILTDVSDFPFPVLVPGSKTLTHPVPGRTLLVRISQAVPRGAQGLRCTFSVEHPDARPIDFGVWVGSPPSETPTESELSEFAAFSGWTTVPKPFVMRHLTLRLDPPPSRDADIFLAVRVTEGRDVYFCHAYWHAFSVIEAWSESLAVDPPRDDAPESLPSSPDASEMMVPDAVAGR